MELVLAISIILISAAIGMAAMKIARSRSSTRSVALQLKADLQWAREQAMAGHAPAGVLLPGSGVAQSYAVVLGNPDAPDSPVTERVCTWPDEVDVVVACGTWDGLSFTNAPPAFGGRTDARASQRLETWNATSPGRWIAFGRNGTVLTRGGLQNVAGDHFLVVAAGAECTGDSLLEVGPAFTICIAPSGDMALEAGMRGRSVRDGAVRSTNIGALPAVLPPRRSDPGSNRPPEIESLDLTPLPNDSLLPPAAVSGQTFQIRADGTLSLTVVATDPDSDQLSCRWGGDDLGVRALDDPAPAPMPDTLYSTGTRPGAYSVPDPQLMSHNKNRDGAPVYTATVEWTPLDARPGQWYSLGVVVEDMRGGRAARWIVVQIIAPGTAVLAIAENYGETSAPQCAVTNASGGELTKIPRWKESNVDQAARLTPDGRWILYEGLRAYGRWVWIVSPDLQDLVEVTPPFNWAYYVDISPDSLHVLWNGSASQHGPIYITHLDGSDPRNITELDDGARFTADGRIGGFKVWPGGTGDLRLVDRWTPGFTTVQTNIDAQPFSGYDRGVSFVCFDVASDGRVVYAGNDGTYVATPDGAGGFSHTRVMTERVQQLRWSPDGSMLAWWDSRREQRVADCAGSSLSNERGFSIDCVWSAWADPRTIVMRDGAWRLHMVDVLAGTQKVVLPFGIDMFDVRYRP